MLFITHIAVIKKVDSYRLAWWGLAIIIILASKSLYLLTYMLFALVDIFIIRKKKIGGKYFALISVLSFIGLLVAPYFILVLGQYVGISETGGKSFSFLAQIPVIGWIIKYIYALLSPFPWTIASHHIETIYTGNSLMFFLHILSAMTGVYFFNILIVKYRKIWSLDDDFRSLIVFGLIMSSTILGGSTGFHGYLSIFFPFFAPLLLYKNFRILPVIPLVFPIGLNILLLFLG